MAAGRTPPRPAISATWPRPFGRDFSARPPALTGGPLKRPLFRGEKGPEPGADELCGLTSRGLTSSGTSIFFILTFFFKSAAGVLSFYVFLRREIQKIVFLHSKWNRQDVFDFSEMEQTVSIFVVFSLKFCTCYVVLFGIDSVFENAHYFRNKKSSTPTENFFWMANEDASLSPGPEAGFRTRYSNMITNIMYLSKSHVPRISAFDIYSTEIISRITAKTTYCTIFLFFLVFLEMQLIWINFCLTIPQFYSFFSSSTCPIVILGKFYFNVTENNEKISEKNVMKNRIIFIYFLESKSSEFFFNSVITV